MYVQYQAYTYFGYFKRQNSHDTGHSNSDRTSGNPKSLIAERKTNVMAGRKMRTENRKEEQEEREKQEGVREKRTNKILKPLKRQSKASYYIKCKNTISSEDTKLCSDSKLWCLPRY